MPWITLPFKDKRINVLSEHFGVGGIPFFVVIDPATGKVITEEGRGAVTEDPEGADFPWVPKPLSSVEGAGGKLNDNACLIYNESNMKDETMEILKKVANQNWDQWKKEGKEPQLYFFHGKGGDLAKRVLEFTKVTGDTALLILDIPSRCKYICSLKEALTEETLNVFVDSWKAGKLQAVPLG